MKYSPSIIVKCLSNQAIYFNKQYGQMFYYTDQNQMWYDTQDNNRILCNDITILQFERQRNNFIPNVLTDFASEAEFLSYAVTQNLHSIVYVIETNSLYDYAANTGVWSTIYGKYGQKNVAQTYLPDGSAKVVVPDDVSTNGILDDGSVVVRDKNKMICGQFRSDGYLLTLASLIGGCINLEPSGSDSGSGCLQLTASYDSFENAQAYLNADLYVFGNIKSLDSSNWAKQYRLVKETISISESSTIKKGSTLKTNSRLGDTTYSEDTILTEDITTDSGSIVSGSKLYIGTVLNNESLVPPYMIDTDNIDSTYINKNIQVEANKITVENGDTLKIDVDFSFANSGDCCYISIPESCDITTITKIKFKRDFEYTVEFIAESGLENTCRICYYALNNSVKILP